MSDSWYLVPSAGSNTALDPRHPKYADRFDGHSSYFLDQANQFVVRFFGPSDAHESTRAEVDVVSLPAQEAVSQLNDVLGVEYTIEQWEAKLFVEQ